MADVKGYTPISDDNKALANCSKELEERVMRFLDGLETLPNTDKRAVAIARTNMQTGFMFAVRSIFKPERIELPEDYND